MSAQRKMVKNSKEGKIHLIIAKNVLIMALIILIPFNIFYFIILIVPTTLIFKNFRQVSKYIKNSKKFSDSINVAVWLIYFMGLVSIALLLVGLYSLVGPSDFSAQDSWGFSYRGIIILILALIDLALSITSVIIFKINSK